MEIFSCSETLSVFASTSGWPYHPELCLGILDIFNEICIKDCILDVKEGHFVYIKMNVFNKHEKICERLMGGNDDDCFCT